MNSMKVLLLYMLGYMHAYYQPVATRNPVRLALTYAPKTPAVAIGSRYAPRHSNLTKILFPETFFDITSPAPNSAIGIDTLATVNNTASTIAQILNKVPEVTTVETTSAKSTTGIETISTVNNTGSTVARILSKASEVTTAEITALSAHIITEAPRSEKSTNGAEVYQARAEMANFTMNSIFDVNETLNGTLTSVPYDDAEVHQDADTISKNLNAELQYNIVILKNILQNNTSNRLGAADRLFLNWWLERLRNGIRTKSIKIKRNLLTRFYGIRTYSLQKIANKHQLSGDGDDDQHSTVSSPKTLTHINDEDDYTDDFYIIYQFLLGFIGF